MIYNFPPTIFAGKNTISQQIYHITSEFDEVLEALTDYASLPDDSTNGEIDRAFTQILCEIMDVYHAIETLCRMLEKKPNLPQTDRLIAAIKIKNHSRNYYLAELVCYPGRPPKKNG